MRGSTGESGARRRPEDESPPDAPDDGRASAPQTWIGKRRMWGLPPRRQDSVMQLEEALRAARRWGGGKGPPGARLGVTWLHVALAALVLIGFAAAGFLLGAH